MKPPVALAAIVLLVLAGANSQLIGRYLEVENSATAIAPVQIPATLDQTGEAGSEVKLVLLALLPEGFDTKEMRLAAGDYVFIIGNRTGLREISVRLDREGLGRVGAATMGGRQRNWKQRMRLTTGTYIVTANDNPDWTCRIIVGE
jgi:hypothetical protein